MDGIRFDTLARSLTSAGSRRTALTAIFGGGLATLGLGTTEAKKRKACPPCKKRNRQGKCKKTKPDGAACAGGSCCDGVCVDTTSDPRNCGTCGTRCQVNGKCAGGGCTCVKAGCGNPDGSCCPSSDASICSCAPGAKFTDVATCNFVDACPAGTTPCAGPNCKACCPAGSICDTTKGTCLQ
jgi:hypothetical protein